MTNEHVIALMATLLHSSGKAYSTHEALEKARLIFEASTNLKVIDHDRLQVPTSDPFAVGAIWTTKDGRSVGNATMVGLDDDATKRIGKNVYVLTTDAGNRIRLIESELDDWFHRPTKKVV